MKLLFPAVTLTFTVFGPVVRPVFPVTSTVASTSVARATTVTEVVPGSTSIDPSGSTEAPLAVIEAIVLSAE